MTSDMMHLHRDEQGFSLLEGMLAAVLLGTGLLAMSAMQGIAFVKNVDSHELTRVTILASDMMERIQFNRRNAISYNGINTQSVTNCNVISEIGRASCRERVKV